MFVPLDRTSHVSLVDQIYSALVERIRSQLHQDGEQLPSVRKLAKELDVSFLTVVNAYKKLEQSGYAIQKHGKGTYVSIPTSKSNKTVYTNDPFNWQLAVSDYLGRSMFGQQFQRVRDAIAYPFHLAVINSRELLPLQEIHQAIQKTSRETSSIFEYAPASGDTELRETIAKHLRNHGCSALSPAELIVTTGCQQGIDIIARTFVGPGDIVAVETPTFPAALDAFRSRGATLISIPMDETGIRIDLFTKMCDGRPPKIIYTIPTGQNPTGTVMDLKKRKALLELAESYNCLIVEDDPWGQLYYEETPPPSLYHLDQQGHVICLKGFNKTISPGLRVCVLAAKGSFYQRLLSAKAVSDLGTPLFNQRILFHMLASGGIDEHFDKLRTELRNRRNLAHSILKKNLPSEFTWNLPAAGPNFWLTTQSRINTDDALFQANRKGISFLPGSVCYPGVPERNSLRISFASLPIQELNEGIVQLSKVLEEVLHMISDSPEGHMTF